MDRKSDNKSVGGVQSKIVQMRANDKKTFGKN